MKNYLYCNGTYISIASLIITTTKPIKYSNNNNSSIWRYNLKISRKNRTVCCWHSNGMMNKYNHDLHSLMRHSQRGNHSVNKGCSLNTAAKQALFTKHSFKDICLLLSFAAFVTQGTISSLHYCNRQHGTTLSQKCYKKWTQYEKARDERQLIFHAH